MKFYIATRLENHAQHNDVRDRVIGLGHEVTYDWTTHGPVWRGGVARIVEVEAFERRGIDEADCVIVLLPGGRGTHVELGYALGKGKHIIMWAPTDAMFGATPETCAFYHNPLIRTIHGPLPIIAVPIVELENLLEAQ